MDWTAFVRGVERGQVAAITLVHGADPQLLERRVKRAAGNEDGRDKPMREGQPRAEREHPPRRTQTFLAPADVGRAQLMAPVVGLELHCLARGSRRSLRIGVQVEDKRQRAPGVTVG